MFNHEITLISYEIIPDDIGNQVKEETFKTILCDIRSTTRTEFYNYGAADLRPEYIATVNSCEYENETDCLFNEEEYTITRSYKLDRDLTELTLSRDLQR